MTVASVDLAPSTALSVEDESRAIMARHARSFSLAAAFLPSGAREDAAILYAFCRWVDDLADEAVSPQVAAEDLGRVDEELVGTRQASPFTGAFLSLADRRGIEVEAARELIRGALSDQGAVRVADDGELLLYAYRVAGVVGLMMCGVLGVRDRAALPFAVDLGIAMQITNICRDVLEDAQRDRCYLPATRLRAQGMDVALPDGAQHASSVTPVTLDLLALADRYYASASVGMRAIPWRTRVAIRVASRLYQGIGHALRKRGGNPLLGRTMLSATERARLTTLGLAHALVPAVGALPPHDTSLHALLPALPGVDKRTV